MRSDEEIIKELEKVCSGTLDLNDCKSELELTGEECIRLNKLCMDLIDEKYILKYELDKKEKKIDETMQLMKEVQEANKKVQEINVRLCNSLKAANRDFFIAIALLLICIIALVFTV